MLQKQAADALVEVQREAIGMKYTVKVYDCYRPQRAVDDFVSWSNNSMDILMKEENYPTMDKASGLFRR